VTYILTLHGINHNDLHSGNIMLDKLKKPIILQYNIGSKSVTFSTKYIVKIYDWDRSTRSTIKNPKLDIDDFEAELGDNNTFNPKRDLYQTICTLANYPEVLTYLRKTINKDISYNSLSYVGMKATSVQLSIKSADDIRKVFQPVDKNWRKSYYNLPLEDIEKIISKADIHLIKKAYKNKIENKSHLYFKLTKGGKLTIPAGWGCQLLHTVKDDFLLPVERFFSNKILFDRITELLNKTSAKPDQICTL